MYSEGNREAGRERGVRERYREGGEMEGEGGRKEGKGREGEGGGERE